MDWLSGSAVIVWGSITLVLTMWQAVALGSPAAMLLAVIAAGMTYVFQAITFAVGLNGIAKLLWFAVVLVTIAAMVTPHVLR